MNHGAPPIAVDLFLTAAFVFVCRWVKRNPSSFLRYTLFPFGGLNVERWPRFMLAIVRLCAICGFFGFLLTLVDLLLPENPLHPTPAILYTKFAACILVSFFALWGTGEPTEADEPTQARPLSPQPSSLPKRPSTPAASAPTAPKTTPAVTKTAPPVPRPVPAAPVLPAPVTAKASASTTSTARSSPQSRLADVEAPPVPNRSNPLTAPPPGVVKERLATIGSSFIMGAIFVGFFYLLGVPWLEMALSIFFALAIVILFFARNAPVGACPFCGGLIERYNRLHPEPVCCDQCHEISKFENERFSPYDPTTVSEKPIFRSPLFENGPWPNGCVLCGEPPVRFDEAKAVRYQARRLLTPRASLLFVPHPAARATGVPYCERHSEAIQVVPPKEMFGWTPWRYLPGFESRMENRRKASLLWRSLPMMRRYLEANRRAKSSVSTGYREPNLLQKTVSSVFASSEPQGPGAASPRPNPNKPTA